ncbi:hypothetical protein [Sinorhizobium meliloti]|uniref:hypothetical protein n=1 Tax=Rhizobium meliloti TaxID=382 RepID=UPI000FD19F25|nr:hypothetical protein [Sinorhizobium meliloti]RVN86596.1 hypothetical protein CN101_20305 [Sinorhizobium meliloti]
MIDGSINPSKLKVKPETGPQNLTGFQVYIIGLLATCFFKSIIINSPKRGMKGRMRLVRKLFVSCATPSSIAAQGEKGLFPPGGGFFPEQ